MSKPYTLGDDDHGPVYFSTKTVTTRNFAIKAGERFPNQWQDKAALRSIAGIFGEDPRTQFCDLTFVKVVVPDDVQRYWRKEAARDEGR